MKYSVIVPYWDAELWIGRCCESLQRLEGNFEFILVNDFNADNSKSIAESYSKLDDRFKLYDNERNKGVSGARNTGLDHATGDYITFMDVDDDMFDCAYDVFNKVIKQQQANIYQFNHMRYYTKLDKLAFKYTNTGGFYEIPNLPKAWYGVWNKLFRAEFIKDIRFDETLQYGEDGLFVLECLSKERKLYHAEKSLVTYKHRFDNKQSLTHVKTSKDLLKHIRAYEAFLFKQTDEAMMTVVAKELSILWSDGRMVETLLKER